MLACSGYRVLLRDGVEWFAYNSFLRQASLPHCAPRVTERQARKVLRESGCRFARWDSGFGETEVGGWWYVVRSGPYALEQLSSNTRSKVRRGGKRLQARIADPEEIARQGMRVCRAAVDRYGQEGFLPSEDALRRKVEAARAYPDAFELYGVFDGDVLVGFSENHIQENAVFWESIWYDPARLGDYSSYLLTHTMLDDYLTRREMLYASDGSRSLYHDTNVQAFFIDKFGFERRPAKMHVVYRRWLRAVVSAAWPARDAIELLAARGGRDVVAKAAGLLRQEAIRRGVELRQAEADSVDVRDS